MNEVAHQIKTQPVQFAANLDTDVKDLILQMIKPVPHERINIDQILQHPGLTKYSAEFKKPISKTQIDLMIRNFVLNLQGNSHREIPEVVERELISRRSRMNNSDIKTSLEPEAPVNLFSDLEDLKNSFCGNQEENSVVYAPKIESKRHVAIQGSNKHTSLEKSFFEHSNVFFENITVPVIDENFQCDFPHQKDPSPQFKEPKKAPLPNPLLHKPFMSTRPSLDKDVPIHKEVQRISENRNEVAKTIAQNLVEPPPALVQLQGVRIRALSPNIPPPPFVKGSKSANISKRGMAMSENKESIFNPPTLFKFQNFPMEGQNQKVERNDESTILSGHANPDSIASVQFKNFDSKFPSNHLTTQNPLRVSNLQGNMMTMLDTRGPNFYFQAQYINAFKKPNPNEIHAPQAQPKLIESFVQYNPPRMGPEAPNQTIVVNGVSPFKSVHTPPLPQQVRHLSPVPIQRIGVQPEFARPNKQEIGNLNGQKIPLFSASKNGDQSPQHPQFYHKN